MNETEILKIVLNQYRKLIKELLKQLKDGEKHEQN